MNYEAVIGLEVHAELSTKTKIFCSCTNEFGGFENTHCCPVCTGMPGVLPVLNEKVVEYAIKAGLACDCEIAEYSKLDRKNYFYPDLPKAYQISQFDLPLCKNGFIDIHVDGIIKRIGITRIHIEEDAGKLLHDDDGTNSLIDYNRCGVPLIEIVTEPDLRSSDEARVFLETLKSILEYTEVSDCKMQEGSLRCDVNISIRPEGQKELGTRSEIKNINSFKAAVRAMESELQRQKKLLLLGEKVKQETRRWDDTKGVSSIMRTKEEAHDYRYFPDPDLVPIVLSTEDINKIRKTLPELPEQKRNRFIEEYKLPSYDASILTSSKELACLFEKCMKLYHNAKTISNWIMGDTLRLLKENNLDTSCIPFSPENLIQLLELIDNGTITGTIAKIVFEDMFITKREPKIIVTAKGLVQIKDENELMSIVKQVIQQNPQSVSDYRAGKEKAMGYLVGQTMKATKGKGNPQVVNKLIMIELSNS